MKNYIPDQLSKVVSLKDCIIWGRRPQFLILPSGQPAPWSEWAHHSPVLEMPIFRHKLCKFACWCSCSLKIINSPGKWWIPQHGPLLRFSWTVCCDILSRLCFARKGPTLYSMILWLFVLHWRKSHFHSSLVTRFEKKIWKYCDHT